MNQTKKNCHSCKYKKDVPGSAHVACTRINPALRFHKHGVKNGWANYPFNFDPIWMEGQCAQFTKVGEVYPLEPFFLEGMGFSANLEEFLINIDHVSNILNVDRALIKFAMIYGFNSAMRMMGDAVVEDKEKDGE